MFDSIGNQTKGFTLLSTPFSPLARIYYELLSRDRGEARTTGKPQGVGPEAYLNSTSQGPTTGDARKDDYRLLIADLRLHKTEYDKADGGS